MLIKRRLELLKDLVQGYGLSVVVSFVESCRNKADTLTRVSKLWFRIKNESVVCSVGIDDMHSLHHFGVDRSLYLARMVDPVTTREEVEDCVKQCMQCKSIDPSPVRSPFARRTWS